MPDLGLLLDFVKAEDYAQSNRDGTDVIGVKLGASVFAPALFQVLGGCAGLWPLQRHARTCSLVSVVEIDFQQQLINFKIAYFLNRLIWMLNNLSSLRIQISKKVGGPKFQNVDVLVPQQREQDVQVLHILFASLAVLLWVEPIVYAGLELNLRYVQLESATSSGAYQVRSPPPPECPPAQVLVLLLSLCALDCVVLGALSAAHASTRLCPEGRSASSVPDIHLGMASLVLSLVCASFCVYVTSSTLTNVADWWVCRFGTCTRPSGTRRRCATWSRSTASACASWWC